MFLGQYVHSIDSKSRLTVPVRFRAALASGAYVMQGFERNLMVYTTESFERLAKRAFSHTMTDPEVRALRRLIFGGAKQINLDSAGRLLLPTFLQDYAGIENEATIVGTGEYFEIWNPDNWEKELIAVTDPESNAERFASFDLSTE
jgi:MraZ protein